MAKRKEGQKVCYLSTCGTNDGVACISPNGRFIGGMRNDMYEHGGSLCCLVSGAMDELSNTYNFVAVAPLNRPRRYKMYS